MKRQHPTDPNLFWCPKCGTYKAREEFWKHKGQPRELSGWCKLCSKDRQAEAYKDNPEKFIGISIKSYEKNRGKRLSAAKKRYATNRDEIIKRVKAYQSTHKEEKRNYSKDYRATNAERIKQHLAEYHAREDVSTREREYRAAPAVKMRMIENSRKYLDKNKEKVRKWQREHRRLLPAEIRNKYNRERVEKITDRYVKSIFELQGIYNPSGQMIEIKRQQILMKRTLKQFKKWRQENESDRNDVSGKQRADEADHERGIQAGRSVGSAAGI